MLRCNSFPHKLTLANWQTFSTSEMRKHDCQEQQNGNAQLWHSDEAQAPKADPTEIK
jgi:hypothetical protein